MSQEKPKLLGQKINQVMLKVQTVEKTAKIAMGSGSYKAVTHDEVTSLLHLPVAEAGIVLKASVIDSKIERLEFIDSYGKAKVQYMASVTVEVVAINSDDPTDTMKILMPAIAFDAGDKAFGKAISMATKYAYLKLFMLESVDEEEHRNDSPQPPANKPKSQPPKPQANSRPEQPQEETRQPPKPNPQPEKPRTPTEIAKNEALLIDRIKSELANQSKGMKPDQKVSWLESKKIAMADISNLMGLNEEKLILILSKLK